MADNKAFCILPWIHAQIRQTGDVIPCCRITEQYSYGSIHQNTLEEIWNSPQIQKVRLEMLAGIPQKFCSDCHRTESLGIQSYRQSVNKDFSSEISRIKKTTSEGVLKEEVILYLDVRFSNTCNLKCRTCDPECSTSWYEDHKSIHLGKSPLYKKHLKISDSKTAIADINKLAPNLKKIYFAGGEPLLEKEHYLLLEKLIESKNTEIELCYNTNMSHLKFQKWNIFEMWKSFPNIKVSASIDSVGKSIELLRKGANWNETFNNLESIKENLPHVKLQIYPTIGIMNAFLLPELIIFFAQRNYFTTLYNFEVNMVNIPSYLSICVLNKNEIVKLEDLYNTQLEVLKPLLAEDIFTHIKSLLRYVINFAKSHDLTSQRQAFRSQMFAMDKIRNERIVNFNPELFDVLYQG